jgi:uncharacterized membrane protein YvbJ
MIVCRKCGQENEDTTFWCRKCNRKLYKQVDNSRQATLNEVKNE